MTLAHISDVHFGRIRDNKIVRSLTEDVNARACDVVLVTGDLTQRARVRQFRQAAAWLNTLAVPVLVIPGNHDVYAWWHRPYLRLRDPLRRYRKMIADELMPHFEFPGLAVLGINSAHGHTIKGGYCSPDLASKVHQYFAVQPSSRLKVLAVHHPLITVRDLDSDLDVVRGGGCVWDATLRAGVDLICCGHAHLSHVTHADAGRGAVISLAGSAASDRWRAPQQGVNTWHYIRIERDLLTITVRHYNPTVGCFGSGAQHKFMYTNGTVGWHSICN